MLGALLDPGRRLLGTANTARQVAVRNGAGLAGRAAGAALRVPLAGAGVAVTAATSLTKEGLSLADEIRRGVAPGSRELLDVGPQPSHRQVWSGHGHAHIEVRGMTGSGARRRRLSAGCASFGGCAGPRSTR
jgi:hypothetical protein